MSATFSLNATVAPDAILQKEVLDALVLDPLEAASIGVTVCHGVVTLYGRVHSRDEKWMAERVCSEMPGVRAVANELEVDADPELKINDSTLAETAVDELMWHDVASPGSIHVTVSDRWVTLSGVVASLHERATAERLIRGLRGVQGVSNALGIAGRVVPAGQCMLG